MRQNVFFADKTTAIRAAEAVVCTFTGAKTSTTPTKKTTTTV
jgi:hypothetical protein